MSGSKWRYKPEKCDGDFCPGECDNCPKCWEDAEDETGLKDVIETLSGYEKRFIGIDHYEEASLIHDLLSMLKGDNDGLQGV